MAAAVTMGIAPAFDVTEAAPDATALVALAAFDVADEAASEDFDELALLVPDDEPLEPDDEPLDVVLVAIVLVIVLPSVVMVVTLPPPIAPMAVNMVLLPVVVS